MKRGLSQRSILVYLSPSPNTEPLFVCVSHTHVVAASHSALYIWHYRTASRLAVTELTHLSRKGWDGQERYIQCIYIVYVANYTCIYTCTPIPVVQYPFSHSGFLTFPFHFGQYVYTCISTVFLSPHNLIPPFPCFHVSFQDNPC